MEHWLTSFWYLDSLASASSENEYNITTAEFELEINYFNLRNFRLDILG